MQTELANRAGSASAPQSVRHLERISNEANRVANLSAMLQSFLDRFHGQSPEADGKDAAVEICYRNDLDRLSANIDGLDARVNSILALG